MTRRLIPRRCKRGQRVEFTTQTRNASTENRRTSRVSSAFAMMPRQHRPRVEEDLAHRLENVTRGANKRGASDGDGAKKSRSRE